MAHIYLDLDRPKRPWWPELAESWSDLASALLARESVDLMILPRSEREVEVRHRDRGTAAIVIDRDRYSYRPENGDPLAIGAHESLDDAAAFEATSDSDYPDALVQIAHLAASPRSGEIILSAARNWDFRARHEPIPHVSSHGALHREHMLVPLLTNRPLASRPRRTVDVMPSALAALGIEIPEGLDGVSFIGQTHSGPLTASAHLANEPPDEQRGAKSAVA
jgi:hypothetical protein